MQEALSYFTDTWLTLVGLMIFFIFFIVMIIRVYKIEKNYFVEMSQQPLEETNHD